ncbi:MAG TPA: ATP-binding protein [Casimicrobiaceae bacterium]|nr:ATP-binding protein [Casimicrobiaceae bacterium]
MQRAFPRSFDSIPAIVEFTHEAFVHAQVDPALHASVDLVLEELFTNMVKYEAPAATPVRIAMAKIEGGIEVTLVDCGVEPFDVTHSPEVDTSQPIEQRKPGGLGLHLVRQLVDSLRYEYCADRRESRITFRKTLQRHEAGTVVSAGSPHAQD